MGAGGCARGALRHVRFHPGQVRRGLLGHGAETKPRDKRTTCRNGLRKEATWSLRKEATWNPHQLRYSAATSTYMNVYLCSLYMYVYMYVLICARLHRQRLFPPPHLFGPGRGPPPRALAAGPPAATRRPVSGGRLEEKSSHQQHRNFQGPPVQGPHHHELPQPRLVVSGLI